MPDTVDPHPEDPAWHALSPAEVVAQTGTDPVVGLSESEALDRLGRVGRNRLVEPERWTRVRRIGRQFEDVLIWLLLVAALTSGLVIGEWVDAGAIVAIVALNAILGYLQEARAEVALSRLEGLSAPRASVVRSGRVVEVAAEDLVPGDVVTLTMGDAVGADARLIDAVHLELNEASLTGESLPAPKAVDRVEPGSVLAERASMVFAGTSVAHGRGTAVVVETGKGTQMGAIAASLRRSTPPSPLQIELARIGRRLAMVAIAAGFVVFGTGYAHQYPLETMALTGVALAVAAIPEGLPAVVTVTLAAGLRRMAERQAIVRRLPAVEALGAVDVICTDKTGTLTKAQLEVSVVGLPESPESVESLTAPAVVDLLETAVLCSDARVVGQVCTGSPTEVALMAAALSGGIDVDDLVASNRRVDEAAFDSERKMMSTITSGRRQTVLHSKGAPEVVLERCSRLLMRGSEEPLDEDLRAELLTRAEAMATMGLRTMAFARRTLDARPPDVREFEQDMTFLGQVGLRDEIRPEVPAAVSEARRAGVKTMMVTGDHRVTADAIAESAGLDPGEVLHGSELRNMGIDDLRETISNLRGFARVDPIDKVKIVEAWRASGATVAMTGDGVNDAPALRAADVGVSMGSGTDVARDASALVLTDDNYATIVHAIREGRRVFHNIRNVVHYLLSANASEVMYVVIGFLFFGSLGEPLLAVQLLWINLLSDALPAVALGLDSPVRDLMSGRPRAGRDVLSPRNILVLIAQGSILTAAAVATLLVGHLGLALPFVEVRTMVFTTLVFAQLIHAFNVRVGGDVPWTAPGRALIGAVAVSALLQLVIVYTPLGNTLFRTVAVSGRGLVTVVIASAASMALVRWLKRALASRGSQV